MTWYSKKKVAGALEPSDFTSVSHQIRYVLVNLAWDNCFLFVCVHGKCVEFREQLSSTVLVLSGPSHQNKVVRLGHRCLLLLSYLASPRVFVCLLLFFKFTIKCLWLGKMA